ncbi:tyrosine-type recombinase/integrase [Jeotgalibacillus sp. ET6]|uniref:tyrosine-type recombinase/integrase n=1 Tax=Jeotgalibacillus sp. ET6 TaxID=3037260 RepID=UPI002418B915|nr:tyrosine-type recombinase/integrase [Jeotgalibacillus sp. ET6]MDG5473918.1 tyrosine-type recombinase/integrase [Jeotgalibacillus sp. ET6]
MNRTEPIKDLKKIRKLSNHFQGNNDRDYILFQCFLYLGLRTQDTLKLRVGDVRNKYKIHFKEQKTGKTKIIEINPNLIEILDQYIKEMNDQDYLFPSRKKNSDGSQRHITREQAFRRLQIGGEEIGIPLSGHVLRKTFCYHSFKNGTPLHVLSELLNHSSESMTRRYIGLGQENIKQAYFSVDFG